MKKGLMKFVDKIKKNKYSFSDNKGKKMVATLVISYMVLGIFAFVTGGYYKNYDLVGDVRELKADIDTKQNEISLLSTDITSKDSELKKSNSKILSLEEDLAECRESKNSLSSQISSLQGENDDLVRLTKKNDRTIKDLTESNDMYSQVISNSVSSVCCSFGDVQEGNTKKWGIENNRIVCSGDFKVDCSTGEADSI